MNKLIYQLFWKYCQDNPHTMLCEIFPELKGIHKQTKLNCLNFSDGVIYCGKDSPCNVFKAE